NGSICLESDNAMTKGNAYPFGTWNASAEYNEVGRHPWLKYAPGSCMAPFPFEVIGGTGTPPTSVGIGAVLHNCFALRMRSSASWKCSQTRFVCKFSNGLKPMDTHALTTGFFHQSPGRKAR